MPNYSEDTMLFSFKEVMRLIPDMNAPRLQYLIKKGFVRPHYSPTGRGTCRVYSDGDVFMLAIFNALIEGGVDLGKHGQTIKENAHEIYMGIEGIKANELLLLRGKKMLFTTRSELRTSFKVKDYQPQIVLPIGLLKRDLDLRIDQLMLNKKSMQSK